MVIVHSGALEALRMTGWVFAGSPDPMAGGLGDQGGGGLESETTTQRSKHKISNKPADKIGEAE